MAKKKEAAAQSQEVQTERVEDRTGGTYYTPLIDIHETGDSIVVEADMPGVDRSGVEVKIDKGILTVVGRVKRKPVTEDVTQLYEEFVPGDFYRAFSLGDDINEAQVSANITDGVLSVTLPKGRKSKVRKIEVQG